VGSEPATIRREIETTRERLGADLDLLEEKLNPRKMAAREGRDVRRRMSAAASRVRPAVDAAGGKAREGAARLRPTMDAAAGTARRGRARIGPTMDAAAGTARRGRARIGPTIDAAGGRVRGGAAKATGTVHRQLDVHPGVVDAARSARDGALSTASGASARARSNPKATGAMAAGALLVAAIAVALIRHGRS
jgi:hypothetical protein